MTEDQSEIEQLRRRVAELEGQQKSPPSKPKTGCLAWGAGAIGLLLLLGFCASQMPSTDVATTDTSTSDSPAASPQGSSPKAVETPTGGWRYSVNTDPMTDKVEKTACTTSTNEVDLDFPYHDVTAQLCVRSSPKYGTDVYVVLNGDGQILCPSYDSCTIHVRYGQGPRQAISAIGASDNSSNIVFIRSASKAITSLKSADTTKVELQFYQAGSQVLEFRTAGLTWPPPSEPSS